MTIPTEVAAIIRDLRDPEFHAKFIPRAIADRIESALTKAEAVALSEDAGHAMNTALCDFATRWKVDGDYMRCRGCNTPQLAGYADGSFKHAGYCKIRDSAESHPWVTFAELIRPIVSPAVPVESLPDDAKDAARFRWLRDHAINTEALAQQGKAGGVPEEQDYVPGLLDQTCPPKIWLQIDTMGDNEDRTEAVPESCWGDLTWCYEPIGGQEVVYIRADLVPPANPPEAGVTDEMVERRARELLAAEYEREGIEFVPHCIRTDPILTTTEARAVRAISAALAPQPKDAER